MSIETFIAGILTLAIFSFLYRDNLIYKMAESLLLGITVGYMIVVTWNNTLMDSLFEPIFSAGDFWLLVPLALGLMMFGRFHRATSSLVKIPIAVLIGSGAGVAIPAMIDARTIQQLSATISPLILEGGMPDFSAIIVLIGVISTMAYFYFSREHTGVMGTISKTGTYFLMLFFGTTFGYTVMSRMSTLIGRMEFLLTDFFKITQ